MSFVTTDPEALIAAAGNLEGVGSAMAAQNAAAAAPTTGVVPAAADEVSALQATQFAAYGTLYQQISAQATAIQEMFVNTLRTSANSYEATEAANATAGSSSGSWITDLINLLTGSASGPYGLAGSTLGNSGIIAAMQLNNFGSAASDLLQLGSSGFLAPGALASGGATTTAAVAGDGADAAVLASASSPAGSAVLSGSAVSAGAGRAPAVGGLSVPPGWASGAAPAATPAPLAGTGWTTPAPHTAPVAAIPAGVSAMAAADRGGLRFGAPRYGVKPKVMPRPPVG